MLKRILVLYNKLFVIWVIIGGLVAYFFPDFVLLLKDYMEYFFALTMFGIGMVLSLPICFHFPMSLHWGSCLQAQRRGPWPAMY